MIIPELLPGDLIPCGGMWIVRFCQRTPGESSTYAGHLAGVSRPGWVNHALLTVTNEPLELFDANTPEYEVWRLKGLTMAQRVALGRAAEKATKKLYGPLKLGLHLGDWALSWGLAIGTLGLVKKDVKAFRKVLSWMKLDAAPICSLHWALNAYYEVLGYDAWGAPRQQSPDSMHDYMKAHPEQWKRVFKKEAEVATT